MTVSTAMQSAAIRLFGRRPAAFFGSNDNFELELCDLVNEVATDVAAYRDWQALLRVHTITGDGTADAFDLPDDFGRMTMRSRLQAGDGWGWGYVHYPDIETFLRDEGSGFRGSPGGWTIYGNKLRFSPAPTATTQASFPYITSSWARSEDGTAKGAFNKDSDEFLLPERLLTLGLVWRWRENKKLDASGDQEAFIKALDEYAAKDGGKTAYRYGGRFGVRGTYPAWPWALGPA